MPPNVLPWDDSSTSSRHFRHRQRDHDYNDEGDAQIYGASKIERTSTPSSRRNEAYVDTKYLWQEWLEYEETFSSGIIEKDDLLAEALSSIQVMDDDADKADWLRQFGGRLSAVSEDLLVALRYGCM